ncbi:hypothetical protein [Qipengyuania spongiae]|uniref:Uncharacterized protein n=1 Tax=Qipengyuania spongiae TaxID=2909673 RepID=A0ABY5T075_9SPHN|nr:hypothetical protein [Qipengyuania spongiae]UVI39815.1 hypothetical protein L1F33_02300 [Qipengyuania spongiae]
MKRNGSKSLAARFAPGLLAAAALIAVPSTGYAVATGGSVPVVEDLEFAPFTPANVDPALALHVASIIGEDGLRFTPAARQQRSERTVTMAVRVDRSTARAISVRNTIDKVAEAEPGRGSASSIIAPTRYNLGIAKGYQTFAQPAPKALELPAGIRSIAMPDISDFRGEERADKPSRFSARVRLDNDVATGRAPRTLGGTGERSVDFAGSYRVLRNLDVTAGVRVSQDRNRIAPLTDGVEDSQAVYVGTQFRF